MREIYYFLTQQLAEIKQINFVANAFRDLPVKHNYLNKINPLSFSYTRYVLIQKVIYKSIFKIHVGLSCKEYSNTKFERCNVNFKCNMAIFTI